MKLGKNIAGSELLVVLKLLPFRGERNLNHTHKMKLGIFQVHMLKIITCHTDKAPPHLFVKLISLPGGLNRGTRLLNQQYTVVTSGCFLWTAPHLLRTLPINPLQISLLIVTWPNLSSIKIWIAFIQVYMWIELIVLSTTAFIQSNILRQFYRTEKWIQVIN